MILFLFCKSVYQHHYFYFFFWYLFFYLFFFIFLFFLICSEFCHTLKWNGLEFTCTIIFRSHTQAASCDICPSLSHSLDSEWPSLGPSNNSNCLWEGGRWSKDFPRPQVFANAVVFKRRQWEWPQVGVVASNVSWLLLVVPSNNGLSYLRSWSSALARFCLCAPGSSPYKIPCDIPCDVFTYSWSETFGFQGDGIPNKVFSLLLSASVFDLSLRGGNYS